MITRAKATTLLRSLIKTVTGSGSSATTTYHYLALGTSESDPQPDGSGFVEPQLPSLPVFDEDHREITQNEYRRVRFTSTMDIAHDLDNNDAPIEGIIENAEAIMFPEAEHYSWGTITHIGIFSSSSRTSPSEKALFYAELDEPVTVLQNTIPIFRARKLRIGLDNDPTPETSGAGS